MQTKVGLSWDWTVQRMSLVSVRTDADWAGRLAETPAITVLFGFI